jgi:hypothetical protein
VQGEEPRPVAASVAARVVATKRCASAAGRSPGGVSARSLSAHGLELQSPSLTFDEPIGRRRPLRNERCGAGRPAPHRRFDRSVTERTDPKVSPRSRPRSFAPPWREPSEPAEVRPTFSSELAAAAGAGAAGRAATGCRGRTHRSRSGSGLIAATVGRSGLVAAAVRRSGGSVAAAVRGGGVAATDATARSGAARALVHRLRAARLGARVGTPASAARAPGRDPGNGDQRHEDDGLHRFANLPVSPLVGTGSGRTKSVDRG